MRCTYDIKGWTFEQRPVCTEGTVSYVFGTIYVHMGLKVLRSMLLAQHVYGTEGTVSYASGTTYVWD